MFGPTNIAKNSDKEKYVYSGYGITFASKSSWSFGDSAKNVVILVLIIVHHLMLTIARINFLVLVEVLMFGINGSFG